MTLFNETGKIGEIEYAKLAHGELEAGEFV